tara:strand:+ start:332 stop:1027 length:696 start_codon:yes stop_codon:yes gene_type:complete
MSLLKADTIKPVTSGGDLSLQGDSGGSAVDCLNITSAGDINFTGNTNAKIKLPSAGGIYESDGSTPVLTESGGVVTLGSAVVFPVGMIIKTTRLYNDTRTALSSSASNSTRNVLWNFTINKALTTTDLYITASLACHAGSNGQSSWHMRENGSSWAICGGTAQYTPSYMVIASLIGRITAADTSAGDNSIDIGWASSTGKPFTIWNPDSTENADELYYGTQSELICMEVIV